MTYLTIGRNDESTREARTTVRVPDQMGSRLFQGWGPKF
jgi:hypothetical protein